MPLLLMPTFNVFIVLSFDKENKPLDEYKISRGVKFLFLNLGNC